MAKALTHWLLIALVLTLGFGQLLRFEFYGVPIYSHDALVIALLALQGVTLKGIKLDQGIKIFLFGLGIGWIRALTLYPISVLLVPSLYTLRLLAYLGLYLVLRSQKFSLSSIYFRLAGLITLGIGYLQYLFLPDMRIFQYLGWDDHLSRLTLPHFDPTFTAVMLSLALILFIRLRSYIPAILLSCAILLTYSRSVWLSLALTLIAFIRPKKYLLFLIPILLTVIYLLPVRFGEGTNLLRTYSINSRLESDWGYVKKYGFDLVLGRGLNTLVLDLPVGDQPNHATGPNNSYLYLLATTGVLGLLGLVKFFRELYLHSHYKPMLIFFFIASLFNNVMFYPFALLWILLSSLTVPNED